MKKSCRYCGSVHDIGDTCPLRLVVMRKKQKNKIAKFRSTNAWTEKSKKIRDRDHYLCRVCLSEGTLCSDGIGVHHIVPIHADFDRRLDDGNLITLCARHHAMADNGDISRIDLMRLARQKAVLPPGGDGTPEIMAARPK